MNEWSHDQYKSAEQRAVKTNIYFKEISNKNTHMPWKLWSYDYDLHNINFFMFWDILESFACNFNFLNNYYILTI